MTSPYPTAQSQLSAEAKTFNWLLDSFTSGTAGVIEAIAVSSDGLLMAMSAIKDRPNAERLAAVVSGLTSLSGGAGGEGVQQPVEGLGFGTQLRVRVVTAVAGFRGVGGCHRGCPSGCG